VTFFSSAFSPFVAGRKKASRFYQLFTMMLDWSPKYLTEPPDLRDVYYGRGLLRGGRAADCGFSDMVRDIVRHRLRCAVFVGVLAAVAVGAAGCSNETSRFGGENPNRNPYANPYAERAAYAAPPQPVAPPVRPAPRYSAVESQPLPQAQPAYSPPPPSYGSSSYGSPSYGSPSYGAQPYGSQYATLDPPPYGSEPALPPPRATPPYAPPSPPHRYEPPLRPAAYEPPAPSRYEREPPPQAAYDPPRYDPPPRTYAPPREQHPVFDPPPRSQSDYGAGGTSAKLAHAAAQRAPSHVAVTDARAPASEPVPSAPAHAAMPVAGSGQTLLPSAPVYTVTHGDTLGRVAQRYRISVREVAVANGLAPDAPLKVGTRLAIPVRTPTFRPPRVQSGAPAVAQLQGKPAGSVEPHSYAPASASVRVAASEPPAAGVHVAAPVDVSHAEAPAGPSFRWPARGRVINNYGARVNGSTNDGIDLSVPEGTAVRSADEGVVAYAGSELKGYGNLVLVRHANGFVTAYANGSELLVKRNDQVHKGQVVMKSGQTGNAAVPQLHFEIRKNSAPVDPMQYLPSDKTASAPL
jgi:murein DD-endopeptidase MepM/ murein hydrolase activator NlpD